MQLNRSPTSRVISRSPSMALYTTRSGLKNTNYPTNHIRANRRPLNNHFLMTNNPVSLTHGMGTNSHSHLGHQARNPEVGMVMFSDVTKLHSLYHLRPASTTRVIRLRLLKRKNKSTVKVSRLTIIALEFGRSLITILINGTSSLILSEKAMTQAYPYSVPPVRYQTKRVTTGSIVNNDINLYCHTTSLKYRKSTKGRQRRRKFLIPYLLKGQIPVSTIPRRPQQYSYLRPSRQGARHGRHYHRPHYLVHLPSPNQSHGITGVSRTIRGHAHHSSRD